MLILIVKSILYTDDLLIQLMAGLNSNNVVYLGLLFVLRVKRFRQHIEPPTVDQLRYMFDKTA